MEDCNGRYDYDVFLSYRTPPDGNPSWHDSLKNFLESCLSIALDRRIDLKGRSGVRVYLADMSPGNPITQTLLHVLERSKLLVCLISDDYLPNEYCRMELDHFLNRNEGRAGFHSLIYPLLCSVVPEDEAVLRADVIRHIPKLKDIIIGRFSQFYRPGWPEYFQRDQQAQDYVKNKLVGPLGRAILQVEESWKRKPPPPSRPTKASCCVAFYSYRGGIGRSMAVANVAAWLAQQGSRVLIVDWEGQGSRLGRYFRPYIGLDQRAPNRFLDVVRSRIDGQPGDWSGCVVRASLSDTPVSILPIDGLEPTTALRLDPEHMSSFERVRQEWASQFDFVLHDGPGRNGETRDDLTRADVTVLLFRNDDEDDLSAAIETLANMRHKRAGSIPIVPVPLFWTAADIGRELPRMQDLMELCGEWLPAQDGADKVLDVCRDVLRSLSIAYIPGLGGKYLPVLTRDRDPLADLAKAYGMLARLLHNRLNWVTTVIDEALEKSFVEAGLDALKTEAIRQFVRGLLPINERVPFRYRRTLGEKVFNERLLKLNLAVGEATGISDASETAEVEASDTLVESSDEMSLLIEGLNALDLAKQDPTLASARLEYVVSRTRTTFGNTDPRTLILERLAESLSLMGGDHHDSAPASARYQLFHRGIELDRLLDIEKAWFGLAQIPRVKVEGKKSKLARNRLGRGQRSSIVVPEAVSPVNAADLAEAVESHEKMGDFHRVRKDLHKALEEYETAVRLREQLVLLHPKRESSLHELSIAYHRMGDLLMATGDTILARVAYQRGLDVHSALFGQTGLASEHVRPAESHERIGDAYRQEGRLGVARLHYEKAVELRELPPATASDSLADCRSRTAVLLKLGDVERALQRPGEARRHFERAVATNREFATAHLEERSVLNDLSISLVRLGDVLRNQDPLLALKQYEEACALQSELRAGDPTSAEQARDLATTYERMGDLDVLAPIAVDAERFYERALLLRTEVAGNDTATPEDQRARAVCLRKLGDWSKRRGNPQKSQTCFFEGLKLSEVLVNHAPANAIYRKDLVRSVVRVADLPVPPWVERPAKRALEILMEDRARDSLSDEQEDWIPVVEHVVQAARTHTGTDS